MKPVLLVLLTAAALLIARQIAPVDARVGPPDPPVPEHYEDEAWVVLSVSADGRTVRVQGRGGGCGVDPRATVSETASTVTIRVQQRIPADAERVGCTAMARIDDLLVRLSAPIAGRAVIGQNLPDPAIGLDGTPKVPRVVGLRAEDARFALRAQGFRVDGLREGMVLGQHPSPPTHADPARTTVTLTGASATDPLPPLRPVRFRTVAAGGIASSLSQRTGLVVRSEKRWRALWQQLTAGDDPRRALPRVDFAREMLLIATQGSRPAVNEERVRITSVGDTGASLQVIIDERRAAPECNASDVHTDPYHVVRVPRSAEPVYFVRHIDVPPCDNPQDPDLRP